MLRYATRKKYAETKQVKVELSWTKTKTAFAGKPHSKPFGNWGDGKKYDFFSIKNDKINDFLKNYFISSRTKKDQSIDNVEQNNNESKSFVEELSTYNDPKTCKDGSKYGQEVASLKMISMTQFSTYKTYSAYDVEKGASESLEGFVSMKRKKNAEYLEKHFTKKLNPTERLDIDEGSVVFKLVDGKSGGFELIELAQFKDDNTTAKDLADLSYHLFYSVRNGKEESCEHNVNVLAQYNIDEAQFVDFLLQHTA